MKFMETSAKASINVEEAFVTLARDIKAKMDKKLVGVFISDIDWMFGIPRETIELIVLARGFILINFIILVIKGYLHSL